MRKNPPGSNNPINPLYKVATLQLDRQDWTKDKARVVAKLQFKEATTCGAKRKHAAVNLSR